MIRTASWVGVGGGHPTAHDTLEGASTPLRIVVANGERDRRRRLCAALAADPRVGMVTGFGTDATMDQLARLGADVVIVGGSEVGEIARRVSSVRAADGDVRVVALCEPRPGQSPSMVSRCLGADAVLFSDSDLAAVFAAIDRTHVAAANRARACGPRPRPRLLLVLGAGSGGLARLDMAVRVAPALGDLLVLADAVGARGSRRPLADGARIRTGRLNVIGPAGGRVVRQGRDLHLRRAPTQSARARQLALVDSALDATGPGVVVLCLEPLLVAPLAKRRLLNDGAAMRRAAPDRLEQAVADLFGRREGPRRPCETIGWGRRAAL